MLIAGMAMLLVVALLLLGIGFQMDSKQPPRIVMYGSFVLVLLTILSGWMGLALMFVRCRCRCTLCKEPAQIHWLIGLYPLSQSCVHCGAKLVRPPTYAD
jgi:hypothetical protein